MNIDQTAAVLVKIQFGDNREVSPLVIQEWHDTIGDLEYRDVVEAVRMHRRDSADYLMPAHIRENVRVITRRREREQRVGQPKQIEPNHITLDRKSFDAETDRWIEHYRKERADAER